MLSLWVPVPLFRKQRVLVSLFKLGFRNPCWCMTSTFPENGKS